MDLGHWSASLGYNSLIFKDLHVVPKEPHPNLNITKEWRVFVINRTKINRAKKNQKKLFFFGICNLYVTSGMLFTLKMYHYHNKTKGRGVIKS